MSETNAKRETYLDVAKCLAIFLIVVRHVRDYAGDPSVYAGMPGVDNVSVHLPVVAFFAISGYLSRGFLERIDVRKLVRRLVVYLWPLLTVVLGLGSLVCLATYGRIIVPQNGWLRHLFSVGWFFFCLSTCEVVTFAAFAVARGRKALLLLALGAAYGVIWLVPVGLFHALEMIPFFWFGLFALPRIVRMRFWKILGLSLLAVYLLLAFALGDFAERGLAYHETTMHLLDFSWRGFALLLARYALGLAAVCGGILSVKALVERLPALACLSGMGSQTLGVFYVHTIVLSVYFATVAWAGGGWLGRFALAFVLFLVSYALVAASHLNATLSAALWNPLEFWRR